MLCVDDMDLRIGARTLAAGLSLEVKAGECWCVIGPNGAGKSTLLRALAGLREPERGVVKLDGRALRDWPVTDLARERALLPQGRSDAFGYTVMETVMSARHPYQAARYWESENDHLAAYEALQALEVADLAWRDVRTLSGGERQRVAIAAVLAQDTKLLLLDEPASALDLAHQVSVMRLFAGLSRERAKAIVLVSHDLNLARAAATHALLLMGNGDWQAGPAEEVMQADLLGACLGHAIEIVRHGARSYYLPKEDELPEDQA